MKTCPVCKTSLFDDMEVCYGCMYTFGSKPELEQRASEQRASEQQAQLGGAVREETPLAGWSVRLEMRNAADPARSWSMELAPTQSMVAGALTAGAAAPVGAGNAAMAI